MENCVAPGLDEFDVIIRSCIVFSQSNNYCVYLPFYSGDMCYVFVLQTLEKDSEWIVATNHARIMKYPML